MIYKTSLNKNIITALIMLSAVQSANPMHSEEVELSRRTSQDTNTKNTSYLKSRYFTTIKNFEAFEDTDESETTFSVLVKKETNGVNDRTLHQIDTIELPTDQQELKVFFASLDFLGVTDKYIGKLINKQGLFNHSILNFLLSSPQFFSEKEGKLKLSGLKLKDTCLQTQVNKEPFSLDSKFSIQTIDLSNNKLGIVDVKKLCSAFPCLNTIDLSNNNTASSQIYLTGIREFQPVQEIKILGNISPRSTQTLKTQPPSILQLFKKSALLQHKSNHARESLKTVLPFVALPLTAISLFVNPFLFISSLKGNEITKGRIAYACLTFGIGGTIFTLLDACQKNISKLNSIRIKVIYEPQKSRRLSQLTTGTRAAIGSLNRSTAHSNNVTRGIAEYCQK